MSAADNWKNRVQAHHAQSIRAQGGHEPTDFWQPYAPSFHADIYRNDDVALNRLVHELNPEATLLDVGGGAGRYALPLALKCRHVTVVEPSPSMIEEFQKSAQHESIGNITAIHSTWEEADVAPADFVLCSHVLYGVEDIVPFLRKLHTHAKHRVLILMYMDAPQSHLAPIWQRVHQEERFNLPGIRELLPVLWDLDIYPNLEMLDSSTRYHFDSWDDALNEFRRRLYVNPDTPQDQRLQSAMQDLLAKTDDGYSLLNAPTRRMALLAWHPDDSPT